MFSGHNNQEVNTFNLQQQTQHFANIVNQGIPREKLYPRLQLQKPAAPTTTETMAREDMEKTRRRRGTMNAVESQDSTTMYLVLLWFYPAMHNRSKKKSSKSCLMRKILIKKFLQTLSLILHSQTAKILNN